MAQKDLSNLILTASIVIAGIIVVLYQLGYTNSDAVGIATMLLKVVFGSYLGVKGVEKCVNMCADAWVKCNGKSTYSDDNIPKI
jgi:hypothetical protein